MTFVGTKLAAFLARLRDGGFTSARAELEESRRVCSLERELTASLREKRARERAFESAKPNAGEDG